MNTTTSELAVQCPRCHTLLYRHAELGWVNLMTGAPHDAATCARHNIRVLASEEAWADIEN